MIKTIPGRIENGQVVADEPLPPADDVRSVRIVVELTEPTAAPLLSLMDLCGILKDYQGDPKEDYHRYLEEKYLK